MDKWLLTVIISPFIVFRLLGLGKALYLAFKKYGLDISFNVRDGIKISDEWLKLYRDLGCKLATFTFEEYASYSDIQYWIDRGVDYVTTDWHSLEKLELPKSNN